MRRTLFLFTFLLPSFSLWSQIRIEKLVIRPGQVYISDFSDIIVADTLIMMDSSCIRLNELKPDNYIRAKVAVIGRNCSIDGRGVNGKRGTHGANGISPIGPCMKGSGARNGGRGLDGTRGINLFLYIDSLNLTGSLTINLSGGNGGDGGNGGIGGGGSPGTMHCNGGDGGDGGNGGNGGNGGVGGNLSLGGLDETNIRSMIGERLTIFNKGGSFGYGGISGYGGPAGLGPDRKNGKDGLHGKDGVEGRAANNGTILFEVQ